MTEIFGTCHPQFNPLKDAFYRNFTLDGEIGVACSVYMQGEKVVDLWGGYSDSLWMRWILVSDDDRLAGGSS